MRAVICGGFRHRSIISCAAHHGVSRSAVEYALYVTGRLGYLPIKFDDEPSDVIEPTIVHGEALLAAGHCIHRLGVYHGGRY